MKVTLDKDFEAVLGGVPVTLPKGTEVVLACDDMETGAALTSAAKLPVNFDHQEGEVWVYYVAGKRREMPFSDYRSPKEVEKTVADADKAAAKGEDEEAPKPKGRPKTK